MSARNPRALLVPAADDLPVIECNLENEGDGCLASMYRTIGAHTVQTIPYLSNVAPYFDEDGKVKGRKPNKRATIILRNYLQHGDFIVGDCLFAGIDFTTGETVDLPDYFIQEFRV